MKLFRHRAYRTRQAARYRLRLQIEVMEPRVLLAGPATTGTGIFVDSGDLLGAASSVDVALGDLDKDGDLDAFVVNTLGEPNQVYFNQANSSTDPDIGANSGSGGVIIDGGDRDDHGFSQPGPDGILGTSDDVNVNGWRFIQDMVQFAQGAARNGAAANTILAVGTDTFAGSRAARPIQSVATVLGLTLTIVNDAAISSVDFSQYEVLYVPSNNRNTSGGISDAELALLEARKLDIQNFINSGGSLVALTEEDAANPYGWLELPQPFVINGFGTGGISQPLRKTPEAVAAGITISDAELSNGAPYHNEFIGPPGFNGLEPFVLDSSDRIITLGLGQGGFIGGSFVDSGQSLGNSTSSSVALGDVDADGDLDALIGNVFPQPNRLYLNQGGIQGGVLGQFLDSGQALGNSETMDVALADLDGDGDLDAFAANIGVQGNRIWINQGGAQGGIPGMFADSGQAAGISTSVGVDLGDVDNDGDVDAIVATGNSEPDSVWINQGGAQGGVPGTFADSGQSLGFTFSSAVDLGDLDLDGDLDAFFASVTPAGNRIWLNQGGLQGGVAGSFLDSGQSLGNSTSIDVRLGDLDGDTDLDAFIANSPDSQSNRIWINQGGIQGGTVGLFSDSGQTPDQGIEALALGDVDNDNDLDVFLVDSLNQPNRVWLNSDNGNGAVALLLPGTINVSSASGTTNIPVAPTDAAGNPLKYSARLLPAAEAIAQLARELQTRLGLKFTGDYYENWGGLAEKWLQGADGRWYYLQPEGNLFRWSGAGDKTTVLQHSQHIASLDRSFHADPLRLVQSLNTSNVVDDAYLLNKQHQFSWSGNYFEDYLGLGERWLETGAGGWAYITPTGDVFIWSASSLDQHVATLDASYFKDPTRLIVAPHPRGAAWEAFRLDQDVDLTFTGDFYEDYLGLGERWLQARDGRWFYILPDGRVYLHAATDQLMASLDQSYFVDPRKLYEASDPRSVEQIAFDLDKSRELYFDGNDYFDHLGMGEKWLRASDGSWFYIKPDGDVYQWDAIAPDQRLASLDASYHADPAKLYLAPDATLAGAFITVSSNAVTVDWITGYVGDLRVEITVDDGTAQTNRLISLHVL